MSNYGIFTFFTGAGFLDLGFESAGFISLFANEISEDFCKVYTFSRERMGLSIPRYGLQMTDINTYLNDDTNKTYLHNAIKSSKKEYPLIGFVGGPPCPDFSIAGTNKGATGENGKLSQTYIDLICEEKPDFFVFENVKGLWRTARHRAYLNSLIQQVNNEGYAVTARLINALEYGVPQDRDRIILIGIRNKYLRKKATNIPNFTWEDHIQFSLEAIKTIQWPKRDPFVENGELLCPDNIIPELTVEHWFRQNNVTEHNNSNDYFQPRAGLIKMQTFAEGDDSKKCFKRLHRWRYSPTAAYGNNEVHLHPYKARRISVAEALAIQSLPKSFELPSELSLSAKFKTIGNGVPYLAAKGVAETLLDYLDNEVKK